ncbi:hypothetical protein DPMN_106008 [Dreissena polymorpha]|uniref:Uncharacterized protein n=1 Tax=Dreissena polymorpha TaxID=45954 RepID=A0A9D4K4B8_DREPO|nr:hypothetical protein DPMN_106008 [Dreissena polymorpha]
MAHVRTDHLDKTSDHAQIQLLTKFGEDRMKLLELESGHLIRTDRQTDRPTDRQTIMNFFYNSESDEKWSPPKTKSMEKGNCFNSWNLDKACPPIVNAEVWRIMDRKGHASDKGLQDLQAILTAAMVPIIKLAEMFNARNIIADAPTLMADPDDGGLVRKVIRQQRQNIIGTNLLTKFHEDRKINVASRVLTRIFYSHIRKNAPPWQPYIIGMNLLTKFHEDRTVNVASRVKNAPSLGSHFFQANIIIFELIQDIIEPNLLTKFHEDWTIKWPLEKNTPPLPCPCGGHVFQPTGIIFELVQDINGMNLLTKFHEDRTLNVASREKCPPLGSHVFQAKVTIFELIKDISGTNLLTKFHEDLKINVTSRVLTRKNAPPPGDHVFQPTSIIFKLVQDMIGINLLTKFHEDQTINVASRVKNAPPLGSHVFQANVTIFELIQDIIKTNLLTIFHEDWTINVASRE